MKVSTTEVTPISGGRPRFTYDESIFEAVAGIGIFAPTGEVAGAAVIDGNQVSLSYVTTTPVTGDYPLLTVALRIRDDASDGSATLFTLDPASRWILNGTTVEAKVSPGVVTVGGSVAITGVTPGEGWFPAGTVISVRGIGFTDLTRLRVDGTDAADVRVVSSTEIQFTLAEAFNMTAARLKAVNPDSSTSIFYSYMRGMPAATSDRQLLSATEPLFSGTTRSVATFPIPAMSGAQYVALALQNPQLAGADVTIGVYAADGTFLYASTAWLENGHRLTLELSELLDGWAPLPGALVRVASSLPIEMFGLLCDEADWTVTPRLPIEAAP